MQAMTLTLPPESLIGVRIPPRELRQELLRRLAAALFSDGILSGASACRMAGMGKAEFQHLLGERGIAQPLDETDFEQDLSNLAAWKVR
jgi:predicted HTH domain antitoxin